MTSYVPGGWSESHWLRTADLDLGQAIPILQAYALKRQQLLAPGIGITYLRVSNDNTFRDSQILPGIPAMQLAAGPLVTVLGVGNNAQSTGAAGPNNPPLNPLFTGYEPDMDWTAVLMRGEGGAPYTARSLFWIAGIPDNLTFHSNRGIVDATWVGLFQTWVTELTTNWGFLGQDNSAANPTKPITGALPPTPGTPATITSAAHNLTNGQMISIRGVKTIQNIGKGINGTWQVQLITLAGGGTDPNNFNLVASNNLPLFTYASGGTIRIRTKVLIPFAKVLQRRFGSRKRGRPFGLLSGRRPRVHKALTATV